MKILTFAGSLRKDSYNKKICQVVKKFVEKENLGEVEYLDLQPLQIPLYDGDLEAGSGLPVGVQTLCARIQAADLLILSSPEYNGGIAAPFKNAIDWVSRMKPVVPITGKCILLCAGSPGLLGGVRGLWHTRVPLEALGCHVYPEMIGFPKVNEAFDAEGRLHDERTRLHFEKVISEFIQFSQ